MSIAWWVAIITSQPKRIYYLSPFARVEAESLLNNYQEDLEPESA